MINPNFFKKTSAGAEDDLFPEIFIHYSTKTEVTTTSN